jgi:hypothetical protein
METVRLAPNSEVSLYPEKDSQDLSKRCATCAPSSGRINLWQQPPNRF